MSPASSAAKPSSAPPEKMNSLATLFANATSLASVIAAGILASHDKASWPWFLLVAMLTTATVSYKSFER